MGEMAKANPRRRVIELQQRDTESYHLKDEL